MKINEIDRAVICGIGFQTETIVRYLKCNNVDDVCILVNHFTQRPEDCYLIPSKRQGKRNSFSEVDMLMDDVIEGVPVKRWDMLSERERTYTFIVYPDMQSQVVFEFVRGNADLNIYHMTEDELDYVNAQVWSNSRIILELWKTNKYLYSEMELLKNSMRRQLKATVYDFHFEFHLVEHCNLKCAGCTHFSPLAEESFLDIKEFERDINRISELTGGNTRFINLLGGEPLLHPEINAFLDISRKAFPKTIIRIVTNGIKLLHMNDEFWETCRKNKIVIGVTQYPISIDYTEIIEKIKGEGVAFESFSGGAYPRDEMWRLSLDETGSNRPLENFIQCPRANACIFVSNGKVYNCATMANIKHFNKCYDVQYELCEDDCVDIYKVTNAEDMLQKLCNPKPFCRFCSIDNRKYGVKWKASELSIEEWT